LVSQEADPGERLYSILKGQKSDDCDLLSALLDLIFFEFPDLVGLEAPAALAAEGASGAG
jgi:hypothetical protein